MYNLYYTLLPKKRKMLSQLQKLVCSREGTTRLVTDFATSGYEANRQLIYVLRFSPRIIVKQNLLHWKVVSDTVSESIRSRMKPLTSCSNINVDTITLPNDRKQQLKPCGFGHSVVNGLPQLRRFLRSSYLYFPGAMPQRWPRTCYTL